jgi:cell division protein FtsQ
MPGYRSNRWKGARANQAADERRQAQRWRLVKRCRAAARLAVLVGGVAGMLWGALALSKEVGPMLQRGLEIRDVRVEGGHQVTKQDVLDRLALKKGTALHQVSLAFLAERLRTHPWIKEATVERLPLHELRVTLLERSPAAIVRTGTEHVLTDEEGVVLARLGERDEPALPLVTGVELKPLLQGDPHSRRTIQSSVELARLMGNTVDGRVEIDVSDPRNPVALTRSVRFQFGGDAMVEQWNRFRAVKAVMKPGLLDGRKRDGEEVDLRYDNRVIVRDRG